MPRPLGACGGDDAGNSGGMPVPGYVMAFGHPGEACRGMPRPYGTTESLAGWLPRGGEISQARLRAMRDDAPAGGERFAKGTAMEIPRISESRGRDGMCRTRLAVTCN